MDERNESLVFALLVLLSLVVVLAGIALWAAVGIVPAIALVCVYLLLLCVPIVKAIRDSGPRDDER